VLGAAAIAGCTAGLLAAFACGGTSGREDLPMMGMDATMPDTNPIAYVDRMLPELSVPPSPDGGEGGGYPWPSCPPFLPVTCDIGLSFHGCPPDASLAEAGQEVDQEPAIYDDAGNRVLAPDSSACTTYPWLGSLPVDKCVTSNCPFGPGTYSFLPPCNWCDEAGIAVAGPGVGLSRLTNCIALYECIARTGCGANPTTCLCGDASTTACDASGACAPQELAALEPSPTETVSTILSRYSNYAVGAPGGSCAGALNFVYACGQSYGCFVDASAY
jgi:hypothetical protein